MTPTFTMDPGWLVPCADPSTPTLAVPEGAVDAHCHVFGPGERFPYAPERKYTPADAGKEALFALRDHLGLSRNVIVQATCHGTDNAALVDALLAADGRARGVATVSPDVSISELADLDAAGVRAVRFNYVRRLVDPEPDDYYRRIVERIAPLGWHVVIYFEAADLAERWDLFATLGVPVVVDHLGRPDVRQPVDGPEFNLFVRFLEENPDAWAKATCPERLSVAGPPYNDVVPFARRVIDAFSDRVLWGTDWPHPNLTREMPDDGALVDFVARVAPTAEQQYKLLVTNPARLYWGDP